MFKTYQFQVIVILPQRTFLSQGDTAVSMNVKSAWQAGYTGKGVLVAVVDDGVNKDHPDLVQSFVSFLFSYCFYSNLLTGYVHNFFNVRNLTSRKNLCGSLGSPQSVMIRFL